MPRQKQTLTVQPPLAGMVRRTGFQQRPEFTSYYSENFWPVDVGTGRAVTATRPGLANIAAPGTTVNGIVAVNGHATGKPFQSMLAASGGSLYWWDGTAWRYAIGAAKDAADTGRPVYGTPALQHAILCKQDSAPIDFNYVTGEAKLMAATAGAIPEDCRIAFTWEGGLWLAGAPEQPHVLNGSRTGDVYDFDFGVSNDDVGGAFTSSGDNELLLNGPITAGFSHTDDAAVISTMEGIVSFSGHPRRGGSPRLISGSTYILGQGAWAKTPGDTAYMLTPFGLMKLDPQPGAIVTPVSERLIPDELMGLPYDYENPTVAMCYDSRWKGLIIAVRGSEAQAWRYDLETGGFDKMSFEEGYPYVLFEFDPLAGEDTSGVLFGRS